MSLQNLDYVLITLRAFSFPLPPHTHKPQKKKKVNKLQNYCINSYSYQVGIIYINYKCRYSQIVSVMLGYSWYPREPFFQPCQSPESSASVTLRCSGLSTVPNILVLIFIVHSSATPIMWLRIYIKKKFCKRISYSI